MKISILGAGNVGATLGTGWVRAGHEVTFAVRDPQAEKVTVLLDSLEGRARAVAVQEAGVDADAVVLATPWQATEAALQAAGDLSGKVLLDCTNPLTPDLQGLELGQTTSGGEAVAGWARGARVVKIFNTTGAGNMADPSYGGTPLTMLYAGDDEAANGVAAGLAQDLGFDPIRVGGLAAARMLEPYALAWITLAFAGQLGPNFAFQLVRRP